MARNLCFDLISFEEFYCLLYHRQSVHFSPVFIVNKKIKAYPAAANTSVAVNFAGQAFDESSFVGENISMHEQAAS